MNILFHNHLIPSYCFCCLFVVRPTRVYLLGLFCFGIQFYVLLSPYLCFISFLYLDLYVLETMH